MVLMFNHNNNNSQFYISNSYNCSKLYVKNKEGPKNGTSIRISRLPIYNNKSYLRFWAANDSNSNLNENEAYRGGIEPNMNYINGGIVKISKHGVANFKLLFPSAYYKDGKLQKPHFHYRICFENTISNIFTINLNLEMKSTLAILN